mgnify:CR=1 FL=1
MPVLPIPHTTDRAFPVLLPAHCAVFPALRNLLPPPDPETVRQVLPAFLPESQCQLRFFSHGSESYVFSPVLPLT